MKWGMRLCGSWVPISHLNNPTLTQKLRIFTFSGWSGHIWRHPVPPSEILSTSPTNFILRGLAAGGSGGSEVYLHHHVWRYSQHCGGKKSFVPINKSTKCCFFGRKRGDKSIHEAKGFPLFSSVFLARKNKKKSVQSKTLNAWLPCRGRQAPTEEKKNKRSETVTNVGYFSFVGEEISFVSPQKRNKCLEFLLPWNTGIFIVTGNFVISLRLEVFSLWRSLHKLKLHTMPDSLWVSLYN